MSRLQTSNAGTINDAPKELADRLEATLGFADAVKACHENFWYGALTYLRERPVSPGH